MTASVAQPDIHNGQVENEQRVKLDSSVWHFGKRYCRIGSKDDFVFPLILTISAIMLATFFLVAALANFALPAAGSALIAKGSLITAGVIVAATVVGRLMNHIIFGPGKYEEAIHDVAGGKKKFEALKKVKTGKEVGKLPHTDAISEKPFIWNNTHLNGTNCLVVPYTEEVKGKKTAHAAVFSWAEHEYGQWHNRKKLSVLDKTYAKTDKLPELQVHYIHLVHKKTALLFKTLTQTGKCDQNPFSPHLKETFTLGIKKQI